MEFSPLLSKAGHCTLYGFRALAEADFQRSRLILCLHVFMGKFHGEGTKMQCSNQSIHNYRLTLLTFPLKFKGSDPPKLITSEELR